MRSEARGRGACARGHPGARPDVRSPLRDGPQPRCLPARCERGPAAAGLGPRGAAPGTSRPAREGRRARRGEVPVRPPARGGRPRDAVVAGRRRRCAGGSPLTARPTPAAGQARGRGGELRRCGVLPGRRTGDRCRACSGLRSGGGPGGVGRDSDAGDGRRGTMARLVALARSPRFAGACSRRSTLSRGGRSCRLRARTSGSWGPLVPGGEMEGMLFVTTLEAMSRCPWRTFLRRLLKIEPPWDPPGSWAGSPATSWGAWFTEPWRRWLATGRGPASMGRDDRREHRVGGRGPSRRDWRH